jgi:pre-60S factor REI1
LGSSKIYTTENAYRSHINSKKHKENEAKAALKPKVTKPADPESTETPSQPEDTEPPLPAPALAPTQTVDTDKANEEGDEEQTIEQRLAASRRRLQVTDCLFCNSAFPLLEENLTHMASTHSFFIPEAEYLIDLPGLIGYLGEKIAIGNACLYCNRHDGKGREFKNLDAVRKHMIDKSHCKIAYSSEEDQLELGDYYDFTSSYPDAKQPADDDEGEWEDMDEEDEEVAEDAEVIDVEGSSEPPDSDTAEEDDDEIPPSQVTYGDSHTELVLPSGARIGHRSMKRYYAQRFRPSAPVEGEDPKSGTALVRRLLREKNSALVPAKGGYGAYGRGNQLIKARNPGEAREAGRHIREFRDQRRREEFKTKVGFIHNSQKHFRDPLLQ